ncbi:hypothetical protein [Bacillus suaedae]|uniref:Uncharacterized protein n=1 Tax=Halalkalibacter suaedae TaxID=2822140 RepID=A0A940WXP8_9BACI|nr:hypothetical protein [Bacillus suaedae]MBP3950235.1 hypothetical protein [Bacillus suaedae]
MKYKDEHPFDDKLERLNHSVYLDETKHKELGQRLMYSLDKRPKRNILLKTVKYTSSLAAIVLACLIGYQVAQHYFLQEEVVPAPPKTVIDETKPDQNQIDITKASQVADAIVERNDLKLAKDIADLSASYTKDDFSLPLSEIEKNGKFDFDNSVHETLETLLSYVQENNYPDEVETFFHSIHQNFVPNELLTNQHTLESVYAIFEIMKERGFYAEDEDKPEATEKEPEMPKDEDTVVEEEPLTEEQEEQRSDEPVDPITVNNNRISDPEFLAYVEQGQIKGIDVIITETPIDQWGQPDETTDSEGGYKLYYESCQCHLGVAAHSYKPNQSSQHGLKVTTMHLDIHLTKEEILASLGKPSLSEISEMDSKYFIRYEVGSYLLTFYSPTDDDTLFNSLALRVNNNE